MKRYLLVGLIFLVFTGCTQEEDYEFETEPNILALMQIGESDLMPFVGTTKYITVDRTYDITDTLEPGEKEVAKSVKVFGGIDTFNFRPSDTLIWHTATMYEDRAYLNDTTLYHLEVVMSWGDTVTAEAYMPTPIRIHTPADSDTVSISAQPVNPHIITWNPCKNTELYLIYCIPDVHTSELGNISPIFTLPSFTMDTSYTFFLQRMIAPWDFDMHYVLRVIAVSPEYVDYMGMQGPGTSVSNLSSGYGMFGGTSEDSIRVYITE